MVKTYKIVVVGGKAVGKTSVLERAVLGSLRSEKPYIPTIEDIYCGFVETEKNHKEKVRFYDTAGVDQRCKVLLPHYHAIADAYILIYSVTDRLSFQLLVDIKKDIDKNREKKDVPIIILANKSDLVHEKVVANDAVETCFSGDLRIKMWETSIHNRQSLIDPLVYLTSRLVPQPNRSSFPQLSMGRKNKE